jgi:hypothetical protein
VHRRVLKTVKISLIISQNCQQISWNRRRERRKAQKKGQGLKELITSFSCTRVELLWRKDKQKAKIWEDFNNSVKTVNSRCSEWKSLCPTLWMLSVNPQKAAVDHISNMSYFYFSWILRLICQDYEHFSFSVLKLYKERNRKNIFLAASLFECNFVMSSAIFINFPTKLNKSIESNFFQLNAQNEAFIRLSFRIFSLPSRPSTSCHSILRLGVTWPSSSIEKGLKIAFFIILWKMVSHFISLQFNAIFVMKKWTLNNA